MPEKRVPAWIRILNRVFVALQRKGVSMGYMRLLSVPGRTSGELRTTPVSPLTVGGERYIVAGIESADWVKNARSAGWGMLSRGRSRERVKLNEVPVEDRPPILREYPHKVPYGAKFISNVHGIPNEPEEFASLASQCPVFHIVSET